MVGLETKRTLVFQAWVLLGFFFIGSIAQAAAPLVNLSSFLPSLQSPKDLANFMKENFNFTEDEKLFNAADYWQSPEEFVQRKEGDCEDYALFAQFVLNHLGYESYVVSFYDNAGFAHTITVFKQDGRFNVMNEDRLYNYEAGTLEEVLTRVNPFWRWGAIAKMKHNRGWMLHYFKNPAFKKIFTNS